MCTLVDFVPACSDGKVGGTTQYLYYIPAGELTAWPKTEAAIKILAAATPAVGDTNILGEAFTVVATVGKGYWRKIKIKVDTGTVDTKTEGEIGSLSFGNGVGFSVATLGAPAKEFAENLVACCGGFVFAIPDRNGVMHVLGNQADPAHIESVEGGLGLTAPDFVGLAYRIKTFDGKLPMTLKSSLTLDTTPNA